MANCVYVIARILHFSPSLAVAGKHEKRQADKRQAVSDWLNPHFLGTMAAFGYIENLA